MTLMVAASPCALSSAPPPRCYGHWQRGAAGHSVQGWRVCGRCGGLKVFAFDNTSTLTTGKPVLTAVFPATGRTKKRRRWLAAAVEAKPEHPWLPAILQAAKAQNVANSARSDRILAQFQVTGRIARAKLGTPTLYIGSLTFVEGLAQGCANGRA